MATPRRGAKQASRPSSQSSAGNNAGKKGAKPGKSAARKSQPKPSTSSGATKASRGPGAKTLSGKQLMDKKGKRPLKEYVSLPGVKTSKRELGEEGSSSSASSSGSDDEDDDDDGAEDEDVPDVEDMLDHDDSEEEVTAESMAFLAQIKPKELAKSRAYLAEQHRLSKPAPQSGSTAASTSRIPLPKIGPAKVDVNSDNEENVDELSEDDFANMGSSDFDDDDDDDDLSVMSDISNDAGVDSLEGFEDDFDSDDDEQDDDASSWNGFVDSPAAKLGKQAAESEDGSSDTVVSDEDDASEAEDEDDDALENRYATLQAKRQRRDAAEDAKKRKRLPILGQNGTAGSSGSEMGDSDPEGSSANESQDRKGARKPTAKRNRVRHASLSEASEDEDDEEQQRLKERKRRRQERDAQPAANPYGARFGRPSVISLLTITNTAERLKETKEEIALLSREIVSNPELNSMNLLKRLLCFCQESFTAPTGEKADVDAIVRVWAMGSVLAIFLDILPGYRIRRLTEAEKTQRTTQAVIQQREYEDSLVSAYKRFIDLCEVYLKTPHSRRPRDTDGSEAAAPSAQKVLEGVAVRCLCELAKTKSYFNFAPQVIEAVVRRGANQNLDDSSRLCLETLTTILAEDHEGATSLEVVRLVSRLIRARSYLVHPELLTVLLSLRVSDLGGRRAGRDRIDKIERKPVPYYKRKEDKKGTGKGQDNKVFLNKKARKVIKERKEIEAEIAEAEHVVKDEERQHNSTETLKLLFALYFRILKLPVDQHEQSSAQHSSLGQQDETAAGGVEEAGSSGKSSARPRQPLLPAALEGLVRFASLVNVDFFRDLLGTLRDILERSRELRVKLLCVVAALELLSGQGEALNIDLTVFFGHLYALILSLTVSSSLENIPNSTSMNDKKKFRMSTSAALAGRANRQSKMKGADKSFSRLSESGLLLLAMDKMFVTARNSAPPLRALAFSKALLTACLHWPGPSTLRALELVSNMMVREPRLSTMLNTEEMRRDGIYRPDASEEGLTNVESTVFWELALLERYHYDEEVRAAAANLARWTDDR